MTAQNIIQSLAMLLKIQQQLNDLTIEKTEFLKQNEIKKLEELLKAEEKQIKLLGKADENRQKAVEDFLNRKGIVIEDVTLSSLYPFMEENDREIIRKLHAKLSEEIIKMKEQNELNQQLTKQSLQFVNASLEMLSPEPEEVTYKHPENKKTDGSHRSFFDSKA
ncbi:hypothetical protein DCC39_05245 [Pueribacillus theae]|uniref:Flagellar protein FlgN n=1 Tax=Pueribacillus theae TaxID=2171751 RepID=A0A2U1K6V5_9BACI|nr:flagellar protein FlgN [Pueribacillus theae]PWA12628.1 hypothetical protein DCC39_05245 [Pueribacillus theae]